GARRTRVCSAFACEMPTGISAVRTRSVTRTTAAAAADAPATGSRSEASPMNPAYARSSRAAMGGKAKTSMAVSVLWQVDGDRSAAKGRRDDASVEDAGADGEGYAAVAARCGALGRGWPGASGS